MDLFSLGSQRTDELNATGGGGAARKAKQTFETTEGWNPKKAKQTFETTGGDKARKARRTFETTGGPRKEMEDRG